MIEGLYEDTVDISGASVFAGKLDGTTTTLTELRADDSPEILRLWANDDDLQQIQIVSTNIGFARKYTKRYAKKKESQK